MGRITSSTSPRERTWTCPRGLAFGLRTAARAQHGSQMAGYEVIGAMHFGVAGPTQLGVISTAVDGGALSTQLANLPHSRLVKKFSKKLRENRREEDTQL
ncbi:unnamed protein product [Calypogeia fissa]